GFLCGIDARLLCGFGVRQREGLLQTQRDWTQQDDEAFGHVFTLTKLPVRVFCIFPRAPVGLVAPVAPRPAAPRSASRPASQAIGSLSQCMRKNERRLAMKEADESTGHARHGSKACYHDQADQPRVR